MDILGFLLILAGIGIAPRFGVDNAVKDILSGAWAAGRETYYAARRRYVHMAAGPVIMLTMVAMVFQALALGLAWWLTPLADHAHPEQVSRLDLLPLIAAGLVLMAIEGVWAFRSRLAIPHWQRVNGLIVRFPANLPEQEFFHAPLVDNHAAVILDDQGRYVDARGAHANANGVALPAGAPPVVSPVWGTIVDWNGVPTLAQDVTDLLQRVRVRVTNDGEFVDNEGRFVNAAGQFVNAERNVVAENAAELHELASTPVLDPARVHLPGRFSLGWSVTRIIVTFIVMGTWITILGIMAEKTPLFMVGVACVYAMLAAVAVLANVIAWFLLKGTKLMEFVATVVSEEALVALPGIKWSNIKTYLPSGVNILEEESHAAAIRAFPVRLALHLAPFVALVWTWTTPTVASFAVSFTFITGFCSWYLAKHGGEMEVQNRAYQFARILFYALPALCLVAFLYKLLPSGVREVLEGQLGNLTGGLVSYGSGQKAIKVEGPWQNFGAGFVWFLMGSALGTIAFFLAPEKDSGKPRRWFYGTAIALTGMCFLAMFLRGYGLVKNISGETSVRAPEVQLS
ncbi:MAG TPA: hypothetical protein VN397_04200, partial [Candidatus Methylomirabilis sp.]|nr:hypothetical protein [Candidatus Methylomirabilis sp.]